MTWQLAQVWWLLALALPVAVLWWQPARGGAAFGPASLAMQVLRPSRGPLLWRLLLASGLALLALALARPTYGRTVTERSQDGRDLVLVIDLSRSMSVNDLTASDGTRQDRLSAVFAAAADFTTRRPDDRIGLVFFSEHALTSCPLTYDHATVREFLTRTEEHERTMWASRGGRGSGLLGDGTNLGLGLGVALRQLTAKNSLGKAIILITDGADTRELPNWKDPLTAARSAKALDTTVYGIGVGDPQGTMTTTGDWGRTVAVRTPANLLPDAARLTAIATAGGGESFSASDRVSLDRILKRIEALQPTPRLVHERREDTDRFAWPLAAGLLLIALALLMETRMRGVA